MLKSMTAYGRATLTTSEGHFVAEVQSLNRKFLEIVTQFPRELTSLETAAKKWVAARVFRGKIFLRIAVSYEEVSPFRVKANLSLARQLKEAWDSIALDLKLSDSVTLQMLGGESGVVHFQEDLDEKKYRKVLQNVVDQAVSSMIEMKVQEGRVIRDDFFLRIERLKRYLDEVKSKSGTSVKRYQEKLKQRIEEAIPKTMENEDKILREICIYADKVDISEEMTRLGSHLEQMTEILEDQREEKGKVLEFLLQEMQREVNTMGAKSDDISVTKCVVNMKVEIEKIREQVQNVE